MGGAQRLSYWADMLGTNTKEIEEIDVALGHWLAENTPQDALIAVDDIGAIAYISGRSDSGYERSGIAGGLAGGFCR